MTDLADDWTFAAVKMNLRWYNKNYVGTHYGGSLFSMTDPFYMLLIMNQMGKNYLVWDKKAQIKFIKPGRGTVTAEFSMSPQQINEYKNILKTQEKLEPEFEVDVLDTEKQLVAKVWKTIQIKHKPTN